MDHRQATFGNSREILRANGFAPWPCGEDGAPLGQWATQQLDFTRNPAFRDHAPAVLTTCPLLPGPPPDGSGLIADARATWLAFVSVTARDALWPEVDAILGKGPVRIADDGSRTYVFALAGEQFGALAASSESEQLSGQAVGANSFVALDGEWPRGDLLQLQRRELPALDHDRAQAMIDALRALFDRHAPAAPVFARYKPKPLPDLAKSERLEFGNARAMAQMVETNGYDVCAVPWGSSRSSDSWYADYMGRIVWNADTHSMGVGCFANLSPQTRDRALVTVEISGRADLVALANAALTQRLGAGPVRVSSNGTRVRLFRANSSEVLREHDLLLSPPGPYVLGGFVRLRFLPSAGVIVVAGVDASGQPYTWPEGSPLTVARNELPELGDQAVAWLRRDIEAALQPPTTEAAAPPKRGARRA